MQTNKRFLSLDIKPIKTVAVMIIAALESILDINLTFIFIRMLCIYFANSKSF